LLLGVLAMRSPLVEVQSRCVLSLRTGQKS
jgi:hypothetical protein